METCGCAAGQPLCRRRLDINHGRSAYRACHCSLPVPLPSIAHSMSERSRGVSAGAGLTRAQPSPAAAAPGPDSPQQHADCAAVASSSAAAVSWCSHCPSQGARPTLAPGAPADAPRPPRRIAIADGALRRDPGHPQALPPERAPCSAPPPGAGARARAVSAFGAQACNAGPRRAEGGTAPLRHRRRKRLNDISHGCKYHPPTTGLAPSRAIPFLSHHPSI